MTRNLAEENHHAFDTLDPFRAFLIIAGFGVAHFTKREFVLALWIAIAESSVVLHFCCRCRRIRCENQTSKTLMLQFVMLISFFAAVTAWISVGLENNKQLLLVSSLLVTLASLATCWIS